LNRRIVLLYLLLLGLAVALGWLGYSHWKRDRAQQAKVLRQSVPAKGILPPAVPEVAKPAAPAEYFDVAQRTLFSKDRNPTVVIEPPPVKPEPPMPPLPEYHGQMAIGDPVAILSTPGGTQKGYRLGEKVGEFKLVAFDREKIKFEWNEKSVERKLTDLVAKEDTSQAAKGPVPQQPAPAAVSSSDGRPAANNSLSTNTNSSPTFGSEIGDGVYACASGDNSAAGTILNGHKKTLYTTMFGPVCRWEPTK
jgi:hypothetical protein